MAFGLGGLPESYGLPKGRLWRYDPDGSLHEMASGFVCGNGVDWSPDNKICEFWRVRSGADAGANDCKSI